MCLYKRNAKWASSPEYVSYHLSYVTCIHFSSPPIVRYSIGYLRGTIASNKVVAAGASVSDGAGLLAAILGDDNAIGAGGTYMAESQRPFGRLDRNEGREHVMSYLQCRRSRWP